MDFEEKVKNEITDHYKKELNSNLASQGVDVSPGNVLHDLFFRKHVELISPLIYEIGEYKYKQDFTKPDRLTFEDMVKFAGNFFVNVRAGKTARGSVRLYFSVPIDISVPKDTRFQTVSGLGFLSVEDVNISAQSMITQTERFFYYLDVPVISEKEGERYNVSAGEIVSCSNSFITNRAAKISNPQATSGASNLETVHSLYQRIMNSLAVRNLANEPSIRTSLFNTHPSIKRTKVIPTGDANMYRDRVTISGIEHRVGNKVDIYVENSGISQKRKEIEKTQSGSVIPFGYNKEENVPVVLRITKVEVTNVQGGAAQEVGWSYKQKLHNENSARQEGEITLSNSSPGFFRITYLGDDELGKLQERVDDPDVRMPVGDNLVKGFKISFAKGAVHYKGPTPENEMKHDMEDFFRRYTRDKFKVSDLVESMYRAGASYVKLPIQLTIDRDETFSPRTESVNDSYALRFDETVLLHPTDLKFIKEDD